MDPSDARHYAVAYGGQGTNQGIGLGVIVRSSRSSDPAERAMVVLRMYVQLRLNAASSLKDKRMVLRSVDEPGLIRPISSPPGMAAPAAPTRSPSWLAWTVGDTSLTVTAGSIAIGSRAFISPSCSRTTPS